MLSSVLARFSFSPTHSHTHIFYLATSTPPSAPSHFFHLSWLSQHAVSSFSTVKFLELCWCPSAIEMENESRSLKENEKGRQKRGGVVMTIQITLFFHHPCHFLPVPTPFFISPSEPLLLVDFGSL